jgi:hypothetical protein
MTDEQITALEKAKRWAFSLPREQFEMMLVISNDASRRGEIAGQATMQAERDAQAAEIEKLRDALMDCWLKHDEPATVDMIASAALAQETQP